MSFRIAIASGKGGTGKTTVAIGLFNFFNSEYGGKVRLVDCDVEEPNDHIFFSDLEELKETPIFKPVPVISKEKCTYCRKCAEYCEFNAIVVIPNVPFAEVNNDLCHSCGACLYICPENAITETPEPIGTVKDYRMPHQNQLTEGRLRIGSSMQTMLIRETKKTIEDQPDLLLYDSPPGTSCPVVETVSDADFVVIVTEPTPFGLHDLKLMTALLEELGKPFGIVINKAGLGNYEIYDFIDSKNYLLMTEIPFQRSFAASYAKGNLSDLPHEIHSAFKKIADLIIRKLPQ